MCRCQPTFLEDFPCIVVVLIPIYLAFFRSVLFQRLTTGGSPTSLCGQCAYDLAGLHPESPCPECGSRALAMSGQHKQLRWAPRHPLLALFTPLATTLGLVLAQPIATEILVLGYQLDGFSESVARHAIPKREFASHSGIFTPPWYLMLPWMIALWTLPLASRAASRSRAWSLALASLALGLALSVPWGILITR